MARIGGKKRRRRVHRSRRKSAVPVARKRRRRGGFARRHHSRRRGGKGFGSMKETMKTAAMYGLAGAGVVYASSKLGNTNVGGVPLVQKISDTTKLSTTNSSLLLVAAVAAGLGWLLRRRAPKIAKLALTGGVAVAGVALGTTLISKVDAAYAQPQANALPQMSMGGIESGGALPYDGELDGITDEELAGIEAGAGDDIGRGNVF